MNKGLRAGTRSIIPSKRFTTSLSMLRDTSLAACLAAVFVSRPVSSNELAYNCFCSLSKSAGLIAPLVELNNSS